jgi:hypothetical protein
MDHLGDKTGKYGGSIRESGGSLGSYAAAKENEYFKKLDQENLKKLQEEMKKKEQQSHQSCEKK